MSTPESALITGITGQDGSYLAELLLSKGYHVYGLIRRSSRPNLGQIEHLVGQRRLTLVEGDMIDVLSLREALLLARPDEVYNLAAQSHVGLSFSQPQATLAYNAEGAIHLLEETRRLFPEARYYQASTSELFGASPSPQSEETPFVPRSPYATAKLAAHHATVQAREAYGFYACCGILFNHESPRRGREFVTQKVAQGVARIAHGLDSRLTLQTLETARDWGHAEDYVRAMWLMLQQEKPEDYVIATGVAHTLSELCAVAFAAVELPMEPYLRVESGHARPLDVPYLCGDASKAARQLGWEPRIVFDELVQEMVWAAMATTGQRSSVTRPIASQ